MTPPGDFQQGFYHCHRDGDFAPFMPTRLAQYWRANTTRDTI
jgi:hypothetical protein